MGAIGCGCCAPLCYRQARKCDGTPDDVWMTCTDADTAGTFYLGSTPPSGGATTDCYYFDMSDPTYTEAGGTTYTPSTVTNVLSCAALICNTEETPSSCSGESGNFCIHLPEYNFENICVLMSSLVWEYGIAHYSFSATIPAQDVTVSANAGYHGCMNFDGHYYLPVYLYGYAYSLTAECPEIVMEEQPPYSPFIHLICCSDGWYIAIVDNTNSENNALFIGPSPTPDGSYGGGFSVSRGSC